MSFRQKLKNLEYLFKIDLREWLVLFNYETSSVRSLHWTILLLFYALLLQWSIIATTIFSHSPSRIPPISSTQAIIFFALTQSSLVSHTHICRPFSPLLFAVNNIPFFWAVLLLLTGMQDWLKTLLYENKQKWERKTPLETT